MQPTPYALMDRAYNLEERLARRLWMLRTLPLPYRPEARAAYERNVAALERARVRAALLAYRLRLAAGI